jgi:hypothetical protein
MNVSRRTVSASVSASLGPGQKRRKQSGSKTKSPYRGGSYAPFHSCAAYPGENDPKLHETLTYAR